MQSQINRLNNLIRQHQIDSMSITAEKIRLQNQMIILLEENNSLRDKLSRSNIRNTDDLKRQNQRLRLEIEEVINRSQAGAANQHLEQLYQEIDRLNVFIHEREGSYLQMIEDIQELKRRVTEYEAKPCEAEVIPERESQYQNQILELKEEIEKYRSQISQRGFDIVRLNQQVDQLNMELGEKTNDFKTKSDSQDEQIQKLRQQNKNLQNQLNVTKHTLSLVQKSLPETTNPSQITEKAFGNIHLSNMECKKIQSSELLQVDVTRLALQESEWRGKEYEWEKDRLKMEAEITKLKGQLYNIDSSHQQVLKDQASKYQQYISLINAQLAQMKSKVKQITDIQSKQAQEKQPKLNNNLRLQSKLKIAKKTIKQLNLIKLFYQKLLVSYDQLSKQNSQLKQSLILNSTKNLLGVSTNTSLPLFNLQSSKTFTLMNEIVQSQQQIKEQSNDSFNPQKKKQVPKFNNHTKQYEKWLILQGKIQRIKEQNKYLKLTRAVSSYKNY